MTNVEAIVKHPAVSRVYANSPKIELLTANIALQALCRLRRMRRVAKASTRRSEARMQHIYTGPNPYMPTCEEQLTQLRIAHANAVLLPTDLAAMVAAEVA